MSVRFIWRWFSDSPVITVRIVCKPDVHLASLLFLLCIATLRSVWFLASVSATDVEGAVCAAGVLEQLDVQTCMMPKTWFQW